MTGKGRGITGDGGLSPNQRERDGSSGHGACKLRKRRARPARALRAAFGGQEI